MSLIKNQNKNKFIAGFFLASMVLQIVQVPLTLAAANLNLFNGSTSKLNDTPNTSVAQYHIGVIAILVDDDLYNNPTKYTGLNTMYPDALKANTLGERIKRYALDAQRSQEYTESLLIKVNKTHTVPDIANTLEKLYFDAPGSIGETKELSGVVIIGNVPLPVVNKNGNRFVSLFPYTDFEDKNYIYDPKSQDFLPNPAVTSVKPEVWSGIIKPPVGGEEGNELIAGYLDKNTLFHCKNNSCLKDAQDFQNFNKKLLFMDLVNEFKDMDKQGFNNYLRFIENAEDLYYNRFNKYLLEKLMKDAGQSLTPDTEGIEPEKKIDPTNGADTDKNFAAMDFDGDGYPNGYEVTYGSKLAENMNIPTDPEDPESLPLDYTLGIPILRFDPLPNPKEFENKPDLDKLFDHSKDKNNSEDLAGSDALKAFPDIQTKPLIQQFANNYFSLFSKFKADVNDWTNFTGRYKSSYKNALGDVKSDVSTVPGLISAKDDVSYKYLRAVNDAVEKKIDNFAQNPDKPNDPNTAQLQDPVLMVKKAKLQASVKLLNDDEFKGDEIEFINSAEHQYWDVSGLLKNPPEQPKFIDDLFINGKGVKEMTSTKDCSLYRGSNGLPGSIMVEANHTLDVFDKSTDEKYAGCIGQNYNHPERCFKEGSELPLFDILGTKEVSNLTDSATNYRACFDFKEKKRYEEFLIVDLLQYLIELAKHDNNEAKNEVKFPASSTQTPDKIVLVDLSKYDPKIQVIITLKDVLPIWGVVDKANKDPINPDDNMEIGERILKEPGSYTFKGAPLLVSPFIKDLTITVVPEFAMGDDLLPKYLSTFTTNKEPTAETIIAQSQPGKSPLSIPTDNPRFFSFKDKNGKFWKIKYPNLFAVKNIDEAKAILDAKEKELIQIAKDNGVDLPIKGSLTSILEGEADEFHDQAKKDYIEQASYAKIDDVYKWISYNIDQKHQYVLESYLSPLKDSYVLEPGKGYEALYLVGNGESDTLNMNFNGDFPEEEKDVDFNKEEPDPPPTESEKGQYSIDDVANENNKEEEEGIIIFEWFGEMKKWIDKTAKLADSGGAFSESCSISEGDGDYYEQQLQEQLQNPNEDLEPKEVGGVLIPAKAYNTAKFRLSSDRKIIKAGTGDVVKITVEALNKKDELQSDSYTKVNLIIKNPASGEVVKIASINPVGLVKGKATFNLLSTDLAGKFSVTANSPNRKGLSANVLNLESTKKKIRLVSYRVDDAPIYDVVGVDTLVIKENEKVIATVNPKTGMVTIKDNNYSLFALPSKGSKPARLVVQKNDDKKIIASVFFVIDEKKSLTQDDVSIDYFNNYFNLNGIHVKDTDAADGYRIKKIPDNAKFNPGGFYLAQDIMGKSQIFGLVDKHGKIYLNPEFGFDYKKSESGNDPVVFGVMDKGNRLIFEIYLGASYPKIEILKEEGDFEGFNLIAQINKLIATAVDTSKRIMSAKFMLALGGLQKKSEGIFQTAKAADSNENTGSGNTGSVIPGSQNLNPLLNKAKNGVITALQEFLLGWIKPGQIRNFDNDDAMINNNINPLKPDQKLFSDLDPTREGFFDIVKLFKRGIISGYSDGTFKPDQQLSREEFVKLDLGTICLVSCNKFSPNIKTAIDSVYGESPFPDKDVTPDLNYCVKEAKNRQIVSGYKAGEKAGFFVPKSQITRAEAVKVVVETARREKSFKIELSNYPLDGNKPWYYNYVLTAQQLKIFPKNKFKEVDTLKATDFKLWFDQQVANNNSEFNKWLAENVTRTEFAIMISSFISSYDCLQNDQDHDGLPDNYEKYLYSSNEANPDTDGGGIHDLEEVLGGTNILEAKDDGNIDSDNNGMPDLWELKYGLNPYDPSDALFDKDGDNLINLDEYKKNTDPTNPDTDGGGVNDGDEVYIHQTNPLEKKDDNTLNLKDAEGGYVVGDTVLENIVYSQNGAADKEAGQVLDYIDELPADGVSKLFLKASIMDDNGDVDVDDSSSIINFFAEGKTSDHADLLQDSVQAVKGEAVTELQSTTYAGLYKASAEIGKSNIPVDGKTINVVPLDAKNIYIYPASPMIRSGGTSTTKLHVEISDENNNIVNNTVSKVTFSINGPGKLDQSLDEDPDKDGVQISTITGTYDLDLSSMEKPGEIAITATLEPEDAEIILDDNGGDANGSQTSQPQIAQPNSVMGQAIIESRDDIKLILTRDKKTIPSDFNTVSKINLQVVDKDNNSLPNFKGKAIFSLVDDKYGKLLGSKEKNIINGQAGISFMASNLAGEATITVTANGFDPVNTTIRTLPKQARKIELESDSDSIESSKNSVVAVRGKLYDTDGNFAGNDSSTVVNFTLTDGSKDFATLEGNGKVKAKNGIVTMPVYGTDLTGPINIMATSKNLKTGKISLKSVKKFHAVDFKNMAPNVLFSSMMGSDFGNVFRDNYFAGWFVFAGASDDGKAVGKVQAVDSLITTPKPKLRLAQIGSDGRINIFDDGNYGVKIVPNNNSNQPNRFIITDNVARQDLAETFVIVKPQTLVTPLNNDEQIKKGQEGIYLQLLTDSEDFSLQKISDGMAVVKSGNAVLQIKNSGDVKVIDNNFALRFNGDDKQALSFTIMDKGEEIAKISFILNFATDVKEFDVNTIIDTTTNDYQPGVYVHRLSFKKNIGSEIAFSGNSTALPQGIYITDKDIDLPNNQAPGTGYSSLEKGGEVAGLGFNGDNKHMLLFSAGNSVGESNLAYGSEIGVIIGDPTVRISNKASASPATGFTKDIGQEILTGDGAIQELTSIDYNTDGLKDVLVTYQNGQVRLLQNNKGYPRFEDRGIFINYPNGIMSMANADFNKDGQDDLVIATKDSCKQGEVCVDTYINHGGNFERNHLDLKSFTAKNRVYMVRAQDVNNDQYPEIITSDDRGDIRIFYNNKGQIESKGQKVGNLGLHIDNTLNYKAEILVNYDGSPQSNDGPEDDQDYVKLAPDGQELEFVYLDLDPNLGIKSYKEASDLTEPKNILAKDDEVEYKLVLKNSGKKTVKNLMVNDIAPTSMELMKETVKCDGCKNKMSIVETGQSFRPYVYGNLEIPAGKEITISYRAQVKTTPKVKIMVGQNLHVGQSCKMDNYADIGASPDGNTSGQMIYYCSVQKDQKTGKIIYKGVVTAPPGPPPPPPQVPKQEGGVDFNKLDIDIKNADGDYEPDGIPDEVQDWQDHQQQQQASQLTAQEEDQGDELDKAGDRLESIINLLGCSSGCIPMPINTAFLAPGTINAMGIPAGFFPGIPVFAFGVPSIIPVWPPSPYQGSAGGRIYLTPTLTMSMAMGICIGPYLGGVCWGFKVADLIPSGVCDAIAGGIDKAISSAKNFSQTVGSDSAVSTDGGVSGADASGRQTTGGMSGSGTLGNYQYKASVGTNFRIPGFPGVITDWLDRQTEEFINKLTDLPDIYFIGPDLTSVLGAIRPTEGAQQNGGSTGADKGWSFPAAKKISSFRQILSYINSVPLIQIEAQDVLFKIPALSAKEIIKMQRDAQQWVVDTKAEIKRVKEIWKCDKKSEYQTICDKLTADSTALIKSVEKNIETLEQYKELPRKILDWKAITAKYVTQLICYMDAIIKFTGGYVRKQQKIIEAWIDMIIKVEETIRDWKLLIELTIDYQASCDRCSSARFSLIELILKLFLVIPSPPIIPLPKLPDLYIDMSQINVGLKILWPDIKFRPEPIVFPKIPRIHLPDLPSLNITLPAIPVLPPPPELPPLPDLPPLPLPNLPDLPPPPKVPGLPNEIKIAIGILKKIMRIICLIKKGLIPIPELMLRAHLEQLTERSLSPLLPFDLGLNLQFPEIKYDYIDRIQITGQVNFQIDFSKIYDFVQLIADKANDLTTNIVKATNDAMAQAAAAAQAAADLPAKAAEDIAPPGNNEMNMGASLIKALSYQDLLREGQKNPVKILNKIQPQLGKEASKLVMAFKDLEKVAEEYKKMNSEIKDYHLVATSRILTKDDPLLNRSLAEIKNNRADDYITEYKGQQRVVAMRDAFISYLDNQNVLDNQIGASKDLNMIGYVLAQASTIEKYLPDSKEVLSGQKLYASLNQELQNVNTSKTYQLQIQNDLLKELGKGLRKTLSNQKHLLANIALPDNNNDPSYPQPEVVNKGIFVINQQTKSNERLMDYTDEADQPSQVMFIDMDKDNDNDVIYSYGGNIYLKENYKFNPTRVYIGDPVVVKNLEDFNPAHPAVNGFSANYNNNKTVEMGWSAAGYDLLSGYEIAYKTAPDAFDQDLDVATHRVGLVVEPENPDQKELAVPDDATFTPEKIEKSYLTAENIQGDVFFNSTARAMVVPNIQEVKVQPGQTVHSLLKSKLSFNFNGDDQGEIELAKNTEFVLPLKYTGPVTIKVIDGAVEIIDPDKKIEHQKLIEGMKLDYEDRLISENDGSGMVRIGDGSYFRINKKEDLLLKKVENPESPMAQFVIPNGFYYAKIYSFDTIGRRSTPSSISLMAPTICATKEPPFPNAGPSEREVAIFKTLNIDASKSFATNNEIVAYWMDLDLEKDSDSDGDPANDKDLAHDLNVFSDFDGDGINNNDYDDPVFVLGPYEDLTEKKVRLNVQDEASNVAGQEITIKIFVPSVTLLDTTATKGVISGNIDPKVGQIPLSIFRERNGLKTKIITKSADSNGKYFTDDNGEFSVADLNLKDSLIIKNAKGEAIGEINQETGRIILYNKDYYVDVLPATQPMLPLLPTRIVVKDKYNKVISTIILVTDINTDTTIDKPDFPYNKNTVALFRGVHVKDFDPLDNFSFKKLGSDDQVFPGATVIGDNSGKKQVAILDSSGNFYVLENRVSLRLRAAEALDEPLVVEIMFNPGQEQALQKLGEFYVAVTNLNGVQFLQSDNGIIKENPHLHGPLYDSDKDGIPDDWELIYGLNTLDPEDAQKDSDNDGLTNLEEYKAKTHPLIFDTNGNGFSDSEDLASGHDPAGKTVSPFSDVKPDHPYYNSILNLSQRNIIGGSGSNLVEDANNKITFGPDEKITRAEFAEIMLKIFCIVPRKEAYEGPAVFTDMPYENGNLPPYYAITKEAYFQGFVTGYLGEIDKESGKSPFRPNETITRAEASKVIIEALKQHKILELKDVAKTEPWYLAYMQVSTDLSPYLQQKSSVNKVYINTTQEAEKPEEAVTKAEFAAMADRVLITFDCSKLDDDKDGMPSYWEKLNGLNPYDPIDANQDPDYDQLINLEEYKHGTDPYNPDTDAGGVKDGAEVKKGTNPLDKSDDPIDSDGDGLTDKAETNIFKSDPHNPDTDGGGIKDGDEVLVYNSNPLAAQDDKLDKIADKNLQKNPLGQLAQGVYLLQQACLQCPCPAAIEHTADLIAGDKIIAVISNKDDSGIFSRSNEIIIETIPKPEP